MAASASSRSARAALAPGVAPSSSSADAVEAIEGLELLGGLGTTIRALPDFDYLRLDRDYGDETSVLSHTLFGDSRKLPAGAPWELEMGDDGFGFVMRGEFDEEKEDSTEVRWASEVLPIQLGLRQRDNVEEKVAILALNGGQYKCWRYEDTVNKLQEYLVEVQVPSFTAVLKQKVAHVVIPRQGCKWWWCLGDIRYAWEERLPSGKPPARWVNNTWRSWARGLALLGLEDIFRQGALSPGAALCDGGDGRREAPWPTCSSVGLVALLARLAFAPRFAGGLSTASRQESAKKSLKAFLSAFKRQSWHLELWWSGSVVWEPPRPLLGGSAPQHLVVDAEGCVDVSFTVGAGAPHLARLLQQGLVTYLGQPVVRQAALEELFAACLVRVGSRQSQKALENLLMQLCVLVGLRLDLVMSETRVRPEMCQRVLQIRLPQFDISRADHRARLGVAYILAGRGAGEEHAGLPFSITCDHTWVGKRNLMDCALVWPTNVGLWLPPQENPSYVGAMDIARKLTHEVLERERKDWCSRARVWLRGKASEANKWRPVKKKRMKALVFIWALNNALRKGLPVPGLRLLRQPKARGQRRRPTTCWPSASLCSDSGPDIYSAVNFLVRHEQMQMNIDWVPDVNHMAWNSFKSAAKSAGLWKHILLMLMSQLMRHGPWHQASRLQQVREALLHYIRVANPRDDPLFQELYPRILNDKGLEHMATTEGMYEKVWQELSMAWPWQQQGTAVNLNRWFAIIAEARKEDIWWHSRCLAQLVACLECDLLQGKKFKELLRELRAKQGLAEDGEEGEKEMMQTGTAEQRALTNQVGNLLLVSTMTLSDPDNQRKMRLITLVAGPLERWHQSANVRLRHVEEALGWCQEQYKGKIYQMLWETMLVLQDTSALKHIGFFHGFAAAENEAEGAVRTDDEFAQYLGDLALGVASEILPRMLWLLRGWPGATCMMLSKDDGEAEASVAMLWRDYENFKALVARGEAGCDVKVLVQRSLFELVPVQQVAWALEEAGWVLTDDIRRFLKFKHARFLQSQLAEDGFNVARRVEVKAYNKRAPAATVYAQLALAKVLSRRHQYEEIEATVGAFAWPKSSLLKEETFTPGMDKELDPPYEQIVGTSAATSWYTSLPGAHNLPVADLALLESAARDASGKLWDQIGDRWMVCFLQVPHMLVQCASHGGPYNKRGVQWFFVLRPTWDSACLLWPAEQGSFEGCPSSVFFTPSYCDQLYWASVTDLGDWRAWRFCWRSPAWQGSAFPTVRASETNLYVVRAFVETAEPEPLLVACAKASFGDIGVSTLKKLAAKLGLDMGGRSKALEVLSLLIQHILEINEKEALEIVARRMSAMQRSHQTNVAELLALGEGMEGTLQHDQDEIKKEQKAAKECLSAVEQFAEDYQLAMARVRAAEGGKKKKSPKAKLLILPEGEIPQSAVKGFAPPGGSIWRNNVGAGWCGHYPPFARCSAMQSIHGRRGAILRVLAVLWRQHLQFTGQPAAACPVQGLLEAAPEAAAAAASGAITLAAGAAQAPKEPAAKKAKAAK